MHATSSWIPKFRPPSDGEQPKEDEDLKTMRDRICHSCKGTSGEEIKKDRGILRTRRCRPTLAEGRGVYEKRNPKNLSAERRGYTNHDAE